eukprot:1137202-Pelagomonas_calceolata.AAC.1
MKVMMMSGFSEMRLTALAFHITDHRGKWPSVKTIDSLIQDHTVGFTSTLPSHPEHMFPGSHTLFPTLARPVLLLLFTPFDPSLPATCISLDDPHVSIPVAGRASPCLYVQQDAYLSLHSTPQTRPANINAGEASSNQVFILWSEIVSEGMNPPFTQTTHTHAQFTGVEWERASRCSRLVQLPGCNQSLHVLLLHSPCTTIKTGVAARKGTAHQHFSAYERERLQCADIRSEQGPWKPQAMDASLKMARSNWVAAGQTQADENYNEFSKYVRFMNNSFCVVWVDGEEGA